MRLLVVEAEDRRSLIEERRVLEVNEEVRVAQIPPEARKLEVLLP